ncbi:MAG: hypothetical protein E6G97_22860 [Alphaproteobacteria bacterium]|nr:MAG: hypothetical protein E6G97_22860 [Alphaproteobacteria bacterium]
MAWIDSRYLDQQRKLEREILQLRREWDELKLEIVAGRTAARREAKAARIAFEKLCHDLQNSAEQKAGFNPDQPRDDLGKWTDSGRSGDAGKDGDEKPERIRLAGDITGFTKHGINQTINRGVSPSAMHDAVTNPIQILPQSNGTTQYVGRGAAVVLNPLGQVVTTWRQ